MGVSIDGNIYRVEDVVKQIEDYVNEHGRRPGTVEPKEFFAKVADEFGTLAGDFFVIICNEYYEDYNPQYEFFNAVMKYYYGEDEDDEHDFWLQNCITVTGGANADEVLGEVFGVDLKFGYDD